MRAAFDANARNKIVFALGADDARDLARMAPALEPEDFMTLPPYEIYAQVVDQGAPTGWFSARTLPPAESLGTREAVLQMSRDRYGTSDAPPPTPSGEHQSTEPATAPGPGVGSTSHRKARRT